MNIKNQNPLIDRCFKLSDQTLRDIVSGRYDTRDAQGKPTGQVNPSLLGNVLVVNENYPDISECQRLITKIANDTTAWRMKQIDQTNKIWDDKQTLDTLYYGEVGRAIANELLARAGAEFLKTDLAKQFAPPKVWYPTFNLEDSHIDNQAQCQDFINYYPGQAIWNPAIKRCHLIGQAAYDFIFRPITAPEVQNVINSGSDNLNPNAPDATPAGQ